MLRFKLFADVLILEFESIFFNLTVSILLVLSSRYSFFEGSHFVVLTTFECINGCFDFKISIVKPGSLLFLFHLMNFSLNFLCFDITLLRFMVLFLFGHVLLHLSKIKEL